MITDAAFLVKIFQPLHIPWNSDGQAAYHCAREVALVHVLKRRSGRLFPVVDGLIVASRVTNQRETPTSYSGMVHSYHTDA